MRLITPYSIAQAFLGQSEVPGILDNPVIASMLRLDHETQKISDEIPWCSAFVNAVAKLAGCQRTRSWSARSWLIVGDAVSDETAREGWDVVVLKRGGVGQPGPTVLNAQGHVGFFHGWDTNAGRRVQVLGGNQANSVSVETFPLAQILGIRRLS